jgi:hypothetical protein
MTPAAGDHVDILRALTAWEAIAGPHQFVSVLKLAGLMNLPPSELPKLSRNVRRLLQAGYIEATEVNTMGSSYPDFRITGVTLAGQTASRGQARGAFSPVESDFDRILLEPEQKDLLTRLVEAVRSVPSERRQPVFFTQHASGEDVIHPGWPEEQESTRAICRFSGELAW